jgi:hypothetical protein
MSSLVPRGPRGPDGEAQHPHLLQGARDQAEVQERWAVRAAQWRARELAESVFGDGVEARLRGLRTRGPARGLLTLGVPFADLATHRSREARFMAAASDDPILSRVPLIYVFGPGR